MNNILKAKKYISNGIVANRLKSFSRLFSSTRISVVEKLKIVRFFITIRNLPIFKLLF